MNNTSINDTDNNGGTSVVNQVVDSKQFDLIWSDDKENGSANNEEAAMSFLHKLELMLLQNNECERVERVHCLRSFMHYDDCRVIVNDNTALPLRACCSLDDFCTIPAHVALRCQEKNRAAPGWYFKIDNTHCPDVVVTSLSDTTVFADCFHSVTDTNGATKRIACMNIPPFILHNAVITNSLVLQKLQDIERTSSTLFTEANMRQSLAVEELMKSAKVTATNMLDMHTLGLLERQSRLATSNVQRCLPDTEWR